MSEHTQVPEMVVQHEFDDEPTYLVNPDTGDTIAFVYAGNYALDLARLIAAASTQNAALVDLLAAVDHGYGFTGDYDKMQAALRNAREAIALASPQEGRECNTVGPCCKQAGEILDRYAHTCPSVCPCHAASPQESDATHG